MRHRLVSMLVLAIASWPVVGSSAPLPPWGTGESQGEDLAILLVTFGPGSDIPSLWGHTALVVEDRKRGQSRLYNFGMFDFEKFGRFVMGRLEFWVTDAFSTNGMLRFYAAEDRDVRIQELNLPPERRLMAARALAQNVLPANRDYLYHHYLDNCSTRPRDVIDRATDGQLRAATAVPARMTLRDHTRRYTAAVPPLSVLLDFAMNDEIDRPIRRYDEGFLPDELLAMVSEAKITGVDGTEVALSAPARSVHVSTRPPTPAVPPSYGPWLLALGVALAAPALLLARSARFRLLGVYSALVAFPIGFAGTLLAIMWAVTDHTVTFRNENLFLANPGTLVAAIAGLAAAFKARWAGRWLPKLWRALAVVALLGLALKLLPPFDQKNDRIIALLLPIVLAQAWAWRRAAGAVDSPVATPRS